MVLCPTGGCRARDSPPSVLAARAVRPTETRTLHEGHLRRPRPSGVPRPTQEGEEADGRRLRVTLGGRPPSARARRPGSSSWLSAPPSRPTVFRHKPSSRISAKERCLLRLGGHRTRPGWNLKSQPRAGSSARPSQKGRASSRVGGWSQGEGNAAGGGASAHQNMARRTGPDHTARYPPRLIRGPGNWSYPRLRGHVPLEPAPRQGGHVGVKNKVIASVAATRTP